MKPKFEGKLLVLSAPSGSGKTTIANHLLKQDRFNLDFSVSATSRKPREKEQDGKDYYFMSLKTFEQKIKNDEFLEWEQVYKGSFYGTLKTEIQRIWQQNKHVIFDIDVVGALKIKDKFPKKTLTIFVKPPSLEQLEIRLKKRKTESQEKINIRLDRVSIELEKSTQFDKIIENHDLETALEDAEILVENFLFSK